MPQFTYKGRDKDGRQRVGQRFAFSIDALNAELFKEGISPIEIKLARSGRSFWDKLRDALQGETLHRAELAVFARQMQLLQKANVPMVIALKQLATYTRSHRLAQAIQGVVEHLEKGQSLATAMAHYPETFSQLMVSIVQVGESTGHLDVAFAHLHKYIEFELSSVKQIKSSFRYPIFVLTSMVFALMVLNIFVIPSFARFYTNSEIALPWQTRLLISSSNLFVYYGIYLAIGVFIVCFFIYRYLKTPEGKYRWHKLQLRIPLFGKLLQRIILIRFTQSLAIIIDSGIPLTQGLNLVKNILQNNYINRQISQMQESIERGNNFTQSISKVDLFTKLEVQILAVGDKNGELGPALSYISNFQHHEIEYELKRMNDFIGPFLISVVSVLILIIALGVYLPIWNMINLVRS